MRFIAKTLKDTLNERFPDAAEDELLKVCYITAARNHSNVIPVQRLADVIVRFSLQNKTAFIQMSLNTLITSLLNGHPLLLHISSIPLWHIVLNPEHFSALVLHFCCETPGFSLWIINVVSISFSSGKRFLFSLFLSLSHTCSVSLSLWPGSSSPLGPCLYPFQEVFDEHPTQVSHVFLILALLLLCQ